jgi:DNA ligase (NAD+)
VLRGQTVEELLAIDGIGETIAVSIVDYFSNPEYNRVVDALLGEITFADEETLAEEAQILQGQTFVVTGTLQVYANRNAIKAEIERLGGKVAGSVSSKTNYLINNDSNSGSSKNKKAKELSIPILTEEDFISMLKEGQ